jgi:cell division septation protein DedD
MSLQLNGKDINMGATPDTPKKTPTPPEPEVVKRTEAEIAKARSDARNAAAKKYGVHGTNVTKGALASETAQTKRKTLGGE